MSYNNTHDDNNNSSNSIDNLNAVSETQYTNNNMQNIINAPKRCREPSLSGNVIKTPRLSTTDSPFKLLTLVDKRFENLLGLIKTMFGESEARMEIILNKRFDELKSDILDINQRVTKLETVADDIISLKSEVQILKTQIQRQENSVVASDLRINGIPYKKDENLFDVFKSICDVLDVPTPAINSLYRLQNHNNRYQNFSPDAVILVKLYSPYDKNFIMKCLANYRKSYKTELKLSHFGLGGDRPFYVNENLTTTNHKILRSAIDRKKQGLVKTAYTIRGLVYVKFNGNDEPIRVESMEELNNLFRDECSPVNN